MIWAVTLLLALFGSVHSFVDDGYQPQEVVLPGMDCLGMGYDARYRDPFFAYTRRIFAFTYDQNVNGREALYRYPTNKQNFAVPDQVTVRTIGTTQAQTTLYNGMNDMRFCLDLQLTLTIGTPAFEGSIALSLGLEIDQSNNQYMCSIQASSNMWQAALTWNVLSQQFLSDVQYLSGATYQSDPHRYNRFVQQYGSHYVQMVVMGGTAVTTTAITASNNTFALKLALTISATIEVITLSLELSLSITVETIKTQTQSNAKILGGDARIGDFMLFSDDQNALRTLFQTWKDTVSRNPAPVYTKLVEIQTVIPNSDVASGVCQAAKAMIAPTTSMSGC